jgi:hypothetical protein
MTIVTTNRCRNCGETNNLLDLGFIGQVAPFFLKRVCGVRLGKVKSVTPWKQTMQRLVAGPQRLLERIHPPAAFIEIQLCEACSFLQTRLPFPEDAINRLYADYREDSYNRERIELEPSYAAINDDVGHGAIELETRISAATRFLNEHIAFGACFTILDFGGADGKFMPRIEARKFVFEISNVQPIAGITRIHSAAELETYSLVQLAHVIEHVVEPLQLVTYAASLVAPCGYLYLETPQEIPAEERSALRRGERSVNLHEHINSYSVEAVTRLIEKAGLRVVAVEATPVDVGWAKAVHIRALGQKV